MGIIFSQIIEKLKQLRGSEITYVSGRNKVNLVEVDEPNSRILVERGGERTSISLERIEIVVRELTKGRLVDVNDALNSGGSDRSIIEALLAHLPNVGYYTGESLYNSTPHKKIAWFEEEIHPLGELKDTSGIQHIFRNKKAHALTAVPKSFILLAGISGTGKTRFVREQARKHNNDLRNYCLIPVRPDWHEPSDLLGYVSSIPAPRFVVTELLRFIVTSWKDACLSASATSITTKPVTEITPFWLCLDEMNLAPVEQYFADFLSVLESREWEDGVYTSQPLLKASCFSGNGINAAAVRADLGVAEATFDGLWSYFSSIGIPLPPNMIVAGTVNMDETTHGFSRKVIDRAFTIDFGAFYPNDFANYLAPTSAPLVKTLSFPVKSSVTLADLTDVIADPNGALSVAFLGDVNDVLRQTPFELAFRALNELMIALVCFSPKDDVTLQAVWDDFLMTKVLPRIDGDSHKLGSDGETSLLTKLENVLERHLKEIWTTPRPDLLRTQADGSDLETVCRSKAKLMWMQERLVNNGFTSFWP